MKITNLKGFVLLGILGIVLSACSSSAPATILPPTRAATQTPWIIYIPVTVTPEPATITPLPTAEVKAAPTRTPTRAVVAAKPAATATKPAPAPPPAAPSPTAAPACNLGTVAPFFPENNTRREYNLGGTAGAAFEFKWTPPGTLGFSPTDPTIGYRIDMTARRGGSPNVINGATVYVSHNTFIDARLYVFEGRSARQLAGNDDATVTWQVTIVKVSGGFDNQGGKQGTEISCGPPSAPFTIQMVFQ